MRERVSIDNFIASGGTKTIHALENGEVIALPTKDDINKWNLVVENELKNARLCKRVGLLTQDYRCAQIKDKSRELPALIMPSFESLVKKGYEIRDHKNPGIANYGTTMLFSQLDNLTNPDYLEKLLKQLIPDIVTAIIHKIDIDNDTINLVITGENYKNAQIIDFQQQRIRLFFFDFSFHKINKFINENREINPSELSSIAEFYLDCSYYIIGSALLPSEEEKLGVRINNIDRYMTSTLFQPIKDKLKQEIIQEVTLQVREQQKEEVALIKQFGFINNSKNNEIIDSNIQLNL